MLQKIICVLLLLSALLCVIADERPVPGDNVSLHAKSRTVRNLEAGKPQCIVTYGTSLTDGAPWVGAMAEALNKDFPKLATVINSGAGGQWSGWGVANLTERVLNHHPDTVFIEFGINDATLDRHPTVAQARHNLETMIDRILQQNPQCEIILMTMSVPIDYRQSRPHIDAYYQMYREVARDRHLLLIDHEPAWREIMQNSPALYKKYLPDEVHPGTEGNQQVIVPAILDTLYGRAPALSPLQRALRQYHATIGFPQPVYTGEPTTLTLALDNPTGVPLTFAGTWNLLDGGSRIQPVNAHCTLAPGAHTTLTFTANLRADLALTPQFSWRMAGGGTFEIGNADLEVIRQGCYLTAAAKEIPAAARLAIRTANQVSYQRANWGGEKDCSAVAWVRKGADAFIVHVEVTDDKLCEGDKDAYKNDSVELYFDFRPPGAVPGGPGYFQIIAAPALAGGKGQIDAVSPAGAPTGITMTSGLRPTGYWVEVTVPFAGFSAIHGTPGPTFHFDYAVNDIDTPGTIKSQPHWASGDALYRTPHLWGVLRGVGEK